MQTLVVTPWMPYPLVFGGAIRTYHMLRMLASFSEVTLLSYGNLGEVEAAEHLETFCRRVVVLPSPRVDAIRRARSLLSRHSFQYLTYRSDEFQRRLDDLAAETAFDVVQVDMTPMGQFDVPANALHVLNLHNIEHELVERRSAVTENLARRAALSIEAGKVRKEELDLVGRFDLVLTTSERETEIVRSWPIDAQVETLVNTVDTTYFEAPPGSPQERHRLVFVGTTHVDANRDGLMYFMNDIFPLIRERVPDTEFEIIGGGRPRDVDELSALAGVSFTGFVPDVRDPMARATAFVVPLRSGGGTRLKILEALSFGLPTVSTSIGAEGLGLVDGEHLLLADDPHEFADATTRVLRDEELRRRLAANGRRFVVANYDWHTQVSRLEKLLTGENQR
jgi:polysaccharide biosynthesis protein PslH